MGKRKPQRRPTRTDDNSCKDQLSDVIIADRLSELPNVIIADILSRLSTKNAAATSALSKRWSHLWTLVTCLRLDIKTTQEALVCNNLLWDALDCEHVLQYRWLLNQFFHLHLPSTLDRVKISFSIDDHVIHVNCRHKLCPSLEIFVPHWIESALAKKVESLEIEIGLRKNQLRFQEDLLTPFKGPAGVACIKYIKHLNLKGCGIRGELVEHFLSNSHLLEHLTISGSIDLTNLKVPGSSSLKFLKISTCESLEQVEIAAPNLVSFVFDVSRTNYYDDSLVVLEYAPSLVNLWYTPIDGGNNFNCFSSVFHQLHTLSLGCRARGWSERHGEYWARKIVLPESTELTCLENLSLKFGADPFEKTLLDLALWVERCPLLRSFTLEIKWQEIPLFLKKKMPELKGCPHQCLKVVKLNGFVGYDNEIELAKYLVKNAKVLEKLKIEPCKEKIPPWASRWAKGQKERKIRKCTIKWRAKSHLQKKLPRGAKLCFL